MELVNYKMYMAALINGLAYEHLQVLRTLGVLLIITCGFLYIQSEGGHTGSLQPVAHWYVSPVVQTFNCVWDFRSLK